MGFNIRERIGNDGNGSWNLEQWETINMKDYIQQGFALQWKDNL
ncbi:MAG: hypothetical protein EZS28_027942, partial [Streblomastix strix]